MAIVCQHDGCRPGRPEVPLCGRRAGGGPSDRACARCRGADPVQHIESGRGGSLPAYHRLERIANGATELDEVAWRRSASPLRWREPVLDQRSEGERFEVVRSAQHEGGAPFVVEWTIQPGRHGPPSHVHPHEDETLRVLSGTARIVLDGEARTVEAGHALRIPAGTPHQVCAASDVPLTARVTYSGDRFEGVLDRMALGGARGFVAMGAHVQRDWAAVRPTSAARRTFMRLLGFVDRVIGRPSHLQDRRLG